MNQGTKLAFKKEISEDQQGRLVCILERLGAILGPDDAGKIFDGARLVRVDKVDRDAEHLFVDIVVKLKL
jgi:hypothetical protein